jgi:peroxiredoxin
MRKIQKIFGLVILTIILASCKFNNGFTIKGHIDGIVDGAKIKLYDLEQGAFTDSTFSKNGDFIFKGSVEYPTGFRIHCKDEYAIFQVENTEITFNSPLKDMLLKSSIQGGKEQELQNELQKRKNFYDVIAYSALDSLNNKKFSTDEDKNRLFKKLNEFATASQQIYINFGKSHPDTYLGLDIIYMNRMSIPKDTLELIYKNLTSKFKEAPRSKALKIFLYEELAQKGKPFIDFHAKTLKGEDFSLSSLKGHYIYLSFGSSNCGACRLENKFLSHHFNEIPNDLSLVSFSLDKNVKYWEKASKSDSIVWYDVSDLEGGNGSIKTQYQVQAIPTSYLIDRNGIIINKFIGFDTDGTIINELKTLIEENKKLTLKQQ